MTDIFISYSSKDREWVARLAKGLEAHGYEVWWDPEILPGQHYQDVIQKALHGATCTVAVWTPNSVASDYVRAECLWAFNKRNLISVLGKDTEIPTPFNAIQIADLRQWRGNADDPNFQRLLRGIKFVQTGESVPPSQQPEPPKKFPWLPTLFISAAVLGGSGIYWQSTKPSSPSPASELNPVKEVSSAKQMVPTAVAPQAVEQPKRLAFEPEMVSIPAGTFTMGCVEKRDVVDGMDDKCYDSEKPTHEVTLDAFQMAKTETTVAQYMACVDAGVCPQPQWQEKGSEYNIKTGTNDAYKKLGSALTDHNYPIVGVSWNHANTYAKWLSEKTNKSYRLPTEAEWEYAARGGTDTAYPWGKAIGKGNANCGSDCGDAFEYTAPVGSFAANGYGLSDMHGNVWEWCEDWYGDYASSPVSNPKGAANGTYRVLRGGAWSSDARNVRSAYRDYDAPVDRDGSIGFRLVLS